jgi:hypothetical protein
VLSLVTLTLADLKKELTKPRMARSAKIAELNLEITGIPKRPSIAMPGTVEKIIPAQICYTLHQNAAAGVMNVAKWLLTH